MGEMAITLGAEWTAGCLSDLEIAAILAKHAECGSIYREIVRRRRMERRRNALSRNVVSSLTEELRSRFTLQSIRSSSVGNEDSTRSGAKARELGVADKDYDLLAETLSGINSWGDEWAVMRSVNAQPAKQRMAASLER